MKAEEPLKKIKKYQEKETHSSKSPRILPEINELILLETDRLTWRLAEKSSSHRERRCYWVETVQPERPHDGCKLSSSSQWTDCSIVLDPSPKFCRQPGLNHLLRGVHGRTPVDALLNPSSPQVPQISSGLCRHLKFSHGQLQGATFFESMPPLKANGGRV